MLFTWLSPRVNATLMPYFASNAVVSGRTI
jgi:hypothetical protein